MNTKNRLELYFAGDRTPSLYRTVFHTPSSPAPLIGERGTNLPVSGLSFIWGVSSHSLSLFFVTAALTSLSNESSPQYLLEGSMNSPAGMIARLLQKRTTSRLHDLFGSDASGRSLLYRMIILGNPRGLHPGPVTAALRREFLSPSAITVFLDGRNVSCDRDALRRLAANIQSTYIPRLGRTADSTEASSEKSSTTHPLDTHV